MSKVLAACLMMAAQTYSVPPAVLVGIYNVEGGRLGQQVANKNGTYDLGPMQINTIWMPELAEYWGVSTMTARRWVRDDACTNMGVAAWILRQRLDETKSLGQAIAAYHSKTPHLGSAYRRKVVAAMDRQGLLRPPSAPAGQITVKARQTGTIGISAKRVAQPMSSGLEPEETRYAARNMIVVHNPVNRDD